MKSNIVKWKNKTNSVHATIYVNGRKTLCGILMVGNNYANQSDEVNCKNCLNEILIIKKSSYNDGNKKIISQVKNGSRSL